LNKRKVGFLEVAEGNIISSANFDVTTISEPFCSKFKKHFNGTWIANFGYSKESANKHIQNGWTDLVSFGWRSVANPDLVEKFATGTPEYSTNYIKDMNEFVGLVYYGGPRGYTDVSVYAPNQ